LPGWFARTSIFFIHGKLAHESIQEYFIREKKVAIEGIDTRALVRHIRSRGAMNAIISSETTDLELLKKKLEEVPSMGRPRAFIIGKHKRTVRGG
jgi:carbamoylphosphate synthase small subunit